MDCKLRAKNCGGCPLLGLDYTEQLKQKEATVKKRQRGKQDRGDSPCAARCMEPAAVSGINSGSSAVDNAPPHPQTIRSGDFLFVVGTVRDGSCSHRQYHPPCIRSHFVIQ